jgi:hypothetical protein
MIAYFQIFPVHVEPRDYDLQSSDPRNNACLVGPPGVGKTAVVEGLAQRIAQGQAECDQNTERVQFHGSWEFIVSYIYIYTYVVPNVTYVQYIYIHIYIIYIHTDTRHPDWIYLNVDSNRTSASENSRLNAPGALKVAWEAAVLVGPGTTGGRGPWDADALAEKC